MICPSCGSGIPDDSDFCPVCGTRLAARGGAGRVASGQGEQDSTHEAAAGKPKRDSRTFVMALIAVTTVVLVGFSAFATRGRGSADGSSGQTQTEQADASANASANGSDSSQASSGEDDLASGIKVSDEDLTFNHAWSSTGAYVLTATVSNEGSTTCDASLVVSATAYLPSGTTDHVSGQADITTGASVTPLCRLDASAGTLYVFDLAPGEEREVSVLASQVLVRFDDRSQRYSTDDEDLQLAESSFTVKGATASDERSHDLQTLIYQGTTPDNTGGNVSQVTFDHDGESAVSFSDNQLTFTNNTGKDLAGVEITYSYQSSSDPYGITSTARSLASCRGWNDIPAGGTETFTFSGYDPQVVDVAYQAYEGSSDAS